jgi:hypothetical protein
MSAYINGEQEISSFYHSLIRTGLPEAILISRHSIACEPDYKVFSLHLP